MIRVAVNGAHGRMGRLACAAIEAAPDLELVARSGRGDDVVAAARAGGAEVVVDFTLPDVVGGAARAVIAAGIRPVIGTSGMTQVLREELAAACAARRLGGVVVPNFAVGAIVMMRLAELAARFLPAVEIVEAHHAQKQDAPSGTAIATAERLAAVRVACGSKGVAAGAVESRARGEERAGIRMHSLRLPGVVAEQSITFGETGQKLVIEHVAYSREAYMPGVLLACRGVMKLDRLVVGLDDLLFTA
ncbi:MAG: 4-hydroxy-tetrahydrodipicolinate reductase [Planctomycetes bacterium]|nr:4-hydroxy-tetrahydrodipicolinate reductase [Planctomycetota bacterium]